MTAREELRVPSIGGSLVSKPGLLHHMEVREDKDSRIWIQGSVAFVDRMLLLANRKGFTNLVCVISNPLERKMLLPDISKYSLKWVDISHRAVRGVLLDSWKFAVPLEVNTDRVKRKNEVVPVIKDIVRPTIAGKSVNEEEMRELLTRDNLTQSEEDGIPAREDKFEVVTRSMFSNTGWCHRKLQECELMDAYDVDVKVRQLIQNVAGQNNKTSRLHLQQAPGKLLHRVASEVIATSFNGREMKVDTDEKMEHGTAEHRPESPQIEIPATPPEATNSTRKPDIKATKDDDAEANVEDWNQRAGAAYFSDG